MIIQIITIAFRNIWKHKTQSLVGILGLAFGLTCFVSALCWYLYETSYDQFYPDSDHIYRVYSFDKQTGKTNDLVSGILDRKLQDQYSAMQNTTLFFIEQNNCSVGDIPNVRLNTLFTDSTFLKVFPQTIIEGDNWHPLKIANNMILTESMAIRLFGSTGNAIGRSVKSTSMNESYIVTAVVKDPPVHTNLLFDAILFHSQIEMQKSFEDESGQAIWTFAMLQMYMKTPPHTDVTHLQGQLRDYPSNQFGNANIELRILPIDNVRYLLNRDTPFTLNFIYLFAISGLLLLCCALFNFLSLHLDLFRQRIFEFRLRSAHGASGSRLIRQMLLELTCAILIVLVLSCFFVAAVYPTFSHFLNIEIGLLRMIQLFSLSGMGVIAVGWFVGFILFWRLSRSALTFRSGKSVVGHSVMQSVVVILQLVMSIVFIVATLIVMRQMRFVGQKDLGFNREGIFYLSGLPPFLKEDMRVALKDYLTAIPQIECCTDTDITPQHSVNPFKMTTDVEWQGKQQSNKIAFNFVTTDSKFAEVFNVDMLKGKWLDDNDVDKIILNEEAVRIMELSDPVGTIIRLRLNEEKDYRVAGVVKNFHTLSFRNHVQPMLFVLSNYPANNFYVRVTSGLEQATIQQMNIMLPKIDTSFSNVSTVPLSELYNQLNYSEQAGLKIFSVLAVVCLLIAIFGVYAVATASIEHRRKEIAIRKVMGAEKDSIVRLFFREYILQVIVAGAIGIPLIYIIMSNWLQGYAYRTSIPWWLLAGVLVGGVAVVLLTIFGQIMRAANSNPAEVVKSE